MMSNLKGCYSHQTDNWKTPKKMYDWFMLNGYIDCFKYESRENELENNYIDKKLFINPPYSKLNEITEWLIRQIKQNEKVVILIPARTDTKYFHRLLEERPRIEFIKGRLHFNDSKRVAPFPSILLIFDGIHMTEGTYGSIRW